MSGGRFTSARMVATYGATPEAATRAKTTTLPVPALRAIHSRWWTRLRRMAAISIARVSAQQRSLSVGLGICHEVEFDLILLNQLNLI
jgi:hypothetical protein